MSIEHMEEWRIERFKEDMKMNKATSVKMLEQAAFCIGDRAAERDMEQERSMATAVQAFNAMYGTNLSETHGWMFMVFLKASRAKQGCFKADDYVDGASYFALAGECHESEQFNTATSTTPSSDQ